MATGKQSKANEGLEPKKLALLRILQIYYKYSDENHPLTQEAIGKYLEKEYDIVVERKSIGRNIQLLKDTLDKEGFEIVNAPNNNGTYLSRRLLEESEIKLLIDSVLASKYIPPKYSEDLIKKLSKLSNKYFKPHRKNISTLKDGAKTGNKQLFYNIEVIDDAIARKKQVSFDFYRYTAKKQLEDPKYKRVSPYQFILHNQRYYLMGYNEYWKEVTFYRVDRIRNIEIRENHDLTDIRSLPGYENGINYKKISALPYLFPDEPQMIEFIAEEWVVDHVVDWFGMDFSCTKLEDGKVEIRLKSSVDAMECWAMQYLKSVEIIKPASLRERIKTNLENGIVKYSK